MLRGRLANRAFEGVRRGPILPDTHQHLPVRYPLMHFPAMNWHFSWALVANQPLHTPRSEFIGSLLVSGGMNVADRRIVERVESGDLVITADIPLAAEVVARGGQALDPRGELYTEANVGERLAVRNLFDELRGGARSLGDQPTSTPEIGKRLPISSIAGLTAKD